ncbi:uncharacterized protein LOC119932310 [Tachyglossus aculeatus]|uniref:uncharacterized protein LOC119932310 n=1 Tax=Tachyglossus aculeatus TaxID=9261 RepID=UPI0018F6195C|nr:uncharacterized protein LOC119932310 [Tachyglossus aculeatus]
MAGLFHFLCFFWFLETIRVTWLLEPSLDSLTGQHEEEVTAHFLRDVHPVGPEVRLSWTEVYMPVRRCHTVLKRKMGEFSLPAYRHHFPENIWCNWTIWSGPRNHILIYIRGFGGNTDCEKNTDKIVFQGVASVVENAIVYACWNKEVHVFATQALAVHVVLLSKNYYQKRRPQRFKAKYFIFPDPGVTTAGKEGEASQVPLQGKPGPRTAEQEISYSAGNRSQASLSLHTGPTSRSHIQASPLLIPELASTWGKAKEIQAWGTTQSVSLTMPGAFHSKSQVADTATSSLASQPLCHLGEGQSSETFGETTTNLNAWEKNAQRGRSVLPLCSGALSQTTLLSNLHFLRSIESSGMGDWSKLPEIGRPENVVGHGLAPPKGVTLNIRPSPVSFFASTNYLGARLPERAVSWEEEKMLTTLFKSQGGTPWEEVEDIQTQESMSDFPRESAGSSLPIISLISVVPEALQSELYSIPGTRVLATTGLPLQMANYVTSPDDLLLGPSAALETVKSPAVDMFIWRESTQATETDPTLGTTPLLETSQRHTGCHRISISPTVGTSAASLEPSFPSFSSRDSLDYDMPSEWLHPSHRGGETEADVMSVLPSMARPFHLPTQPESMAEIKPIPTHYLGEGTNLDTEWLPQSTAVPSQSVSLKERVKTEGPLVTPTAYPEFNVSLVPPSPASQTGWEWSFQFPDSPVETRRGTESELTFPVPRGPSTASELPISLHPGLLKTDLEHVSQNLMAAPMESLPEAKLISCLPTSCPITTVGKKVLSVSEVRPLLPAAQNILDETFFLTPIPKEAESTPDEPGAGLRNLFFGPSGMGSLDEGLQSASQLAPGLSLSGTTDTSPLSKPCSGSEPCSNLAPLSAHIGESHHKPRGASLRNHLGTNRLQAEIQSGEGTQVRTLRFPSSMVQEACGWRDCLLNFSTHTPGHKGDQAVCFAAVPLPVLSENTIPLETETLPSHLEVQQAGFFKVLPVRSCHVVFPDAFGEFSLTGSLNHLQANIWCNWTIWAGPGKHIIVYVKGFGVPESCGENQDILVFQGVFSSVERKAVCACETQGTLTFASQAWAVHILLFSMGSSFGHASRYFRARYYVFTDPGAEEAPRRASVSHADLDYARTRAKLAGWQQPANTLMWRNDGLSHRNQLVKELPKLNDKEELWVPGSDGILDDEGALRRLRPLRPQGLALKEQSPMAQSLLKPTESEKHSGGEDSMTLMSIPASNRSPAFPAGREAVDPGVTLPFPGHPSKTLSLTDLLSLQIPKPEGIPRAGTQVRLTQQMGGPESALRTVEAGERGLTRRLALTRTSVLYSSSSTVAPGDLSEGLRVHSSQVSSSGVLSKGEKIPPTSSGAAEWVTGPLTDVEEKQLPLTLTTGQDSGNGKAPDDGSHTAQPSPRGEREDGSGVQPSGTLGSIQCLHVELLDLETTRTDLITNDLPSGMSVSTLQAVSTTPQPEAGLGPKSKISPSPGVGVKNVAPNHFPGHTAAVTLFPDLGNASVLESPHNPGDVLFEVVVELEHQAQLPVGESGVEKSLVESIKQEISENLKFLSHKVDEMKLMEIKRRDAANVSLTFWLHLRAGERNRSDSLLSQLHVLAGHGLHAQLKVLIGHSVGTRLKLRSLTVEDVNECKIGLEICGNEAECLNGVGTYLCRCKEEFEDYSPLQTGTLCVYAPQSGVRFLFSYLDVVVGAVVFTAILLMLIIGILWLLTKARAKGGVLSLQEEVATSENAPPTPLAQAEPSIDLRLLSGHPAFSPYQPKLRAKVSDWSLAQRAYPSEGFHVSVERSQCL